MKKFLFLSVLSLVLTQTVFAECNNGVANQPRTPQGQVIVDSSQDETTQSGDVIQATVEESSDLPVE